MKHLKTLQELNESEENLNISDVISSKLSKLKCLKNGHIWSDDVSKPEIWRKKSGWSSIGGFPETEERKCVVCGKIETR